VLPLVLVLVLNCVAISAGVGIEFYIDLIKKIIFQLVLQLPVQFEYVDVCNCSNFTFHRLPRGVYAGGDNFWTWSPLTEKLRNSAKMGGRVSLLQEEQGDDVIS
jgi:hypothetical protein